MFSCVSKCKKKKKFVYRPEKVAQALIIGKVSASF